MSDVLDRDAAPVRDRGSTLLEVMVTMIMLGIITSVVAFAITTVLRVTPTTQSDIDSARSLQGLTSRFPSDVSSAPETGVTLSPGSLGCIGSEATAGVNLVELRWTVDESPSVEYIASYRSEPEGSGRAVRRYGCSSAAGFNDTVRSTLTAPLSASPPTMTAVPASGLVRMELQTLDGTPITVEGSTRGASQTLPTTTTSPTLPPPVPCAVSFDMSNYGPVARKPSSHSSAPDELDDDVDLTFTISGDTCGTLTVEYDTGVELKSREITVSGSSGSLTLPEGDSGSDTPPWTAGAHVMSVYNDGLALSGPGSDADLEVNP